MFEGWDARLDETIPSIEGKITKHMQRDLVLMVEFNLGGGDGGHKDLHPKLTKLLVRDDV